MPWQGAEIYVAKVTVGSGGEKVELGEKKLVGGVKGQVSAAYPLWISNETVLFTSDVSGYQNPWSHSTLTGKSVPNPSHSGREGFLVTRMVVGRILFCDFGREG
jgi:hypothetical protein